MNFFRSRRAFVAATLTIAAAAATMPAHAQSIARAVGFGNWVHAAGGPFPIPGMQSPVFANAAGQPFVVTFTSECAVNAPAGNFTGYVDVDIELWNNVGPVLVGVLAPTAGAGDAFCAANGTAGFDGQAMHSVTAFGGGGLPAGAYFVRVVSRTNAGATGGWYGERTLNVSR